MLLQSVISVHTCSIHFRGISVTSQACDALAQSPCPGVVVAMMTDHRHLDCHMGSLRYTHQRHMDIQRTRYRTDGKAHEMETRYNVQPTFKIVLLHNVCGIGVSRTSKLHIRRGRDSPSDPPNPERNEKRMENKTPCAKCKQKVSSMKGEPCPLDAAPQP